MESHNGDTRGYNFDDSHIPVPSGHAPRLECIVSEDTDGIVLREIGSEGIERAIYCENPAENLP